MEATDLVLACCCATSKRVLSCSDTTPKSRNPTHASPAPMPNRRVSDDATQSVEYADSDAARASRGRGSCDLPPPGRKHVAARGWKVEGW
jgi:hypothetical protein